MACCFRCRQALKSRPAFPLLQSLLASSVDMKMNLGNVHVRQLRLQRLHHSHGCTRKEMSAVRGFWRTPERAEASRRLKRESAKAAFAFTMLPEGPAVGFDAEAGGWTLVQTAKRQP